MAKKSELTATRSSFTQGSEEYFEITCQPCKRENQHVEGIGYCQDCGEYLCDTCLKCHKKLLVSRDHILLDKTSMSLAKEISPALPPKPKIMTPTNLQGDTGNELTIVCPKHAQEFTKFFCNEHENLACSVCLSLDHRNCKDVSYIPDVAQKVHESEEFNEVYNSLKMLRAKTKFENNRAEFNENRSHEIHDKALAEIQEFRESIKKHIDSLCEDAVNELTDLQNGEKKQFTKLFQIYNGLRPDIDKSIRLMENKKENNNDLFIEMKLLKEEIPDMQSTLNSCIQSNAISQYTFEKNPDVFDKLSTVKTFGKFRKRRGSHYVTITLLRDINVKSDADIKDCNINGATVLTNGNLAVTDHLNKSIKVIVPNQDTIWAHMVLESEPFDLAVINDTTLAVTMANVDKIQLVNISDTGLSAGKSLELTFTCVGIEFKDDTLIVVCQDPGCLKVIDLEGRVLRTFEKDQLGFPILPMPRSVSLSADKNVVYVTDWAKNKVSVVSLEGEKIAVFDSEEFKKPLGMTCDSEGVLYVSDGNTQSVILLTHTGEYIRTLLGKKDGIVHPWAITIDELNDRLYVGSVSGTARHRNKIKVFQLQYDYI